ncbi:MAG TPA: HD domain-containing phosphohydrolase [Solirubrobacteraceae bacterium]|nr:HD domain-containing phosphohydrolase [Solirubrobacteraceae bacterium]
MTTVDDAQQLHARIAGLEAELAQRTREAADKEQQLERYAADLRETFKEERARAHELHRSYMLTVRALASAVEARDAYTGSHAERVAAYGLEIARAAGLRLSDEPQIEFGFLLHDIGKVAVPDAILFKPGPLTTAERLIIEQHPVTGWEIVRDIDFLGAARDVIRYHHERWDGGGYPDGLGGADIPLSARVFAVADTIDALTTVRPYRRASSFAKARAIIVKDGGKHFDPEIIAAYESVPDEILVEIRRRTG